MTSRETFSDRNFHPPPFSCEEAEGMPQRSSVSYAGPDTVLKHDMMSEPQNGPNLMEENKEVDGE